MLHQFDSSYLAGQKEPLICADCVSLICADQRIEGSVNQRLLPPARLSKRITERIKLRQSHLSSCVMLPAHMARFLFHRFGGVLGLCTPLYLILVLDQKAQERPHRSGRITL